MKENGTIESVGAYWEPSLEIIVNLEPDLVILSGGVPAHLEIADQLGDMGIKAFVTWRGENLTEIYQNIEVLGEICDRMNAASDLIQSMKDRVDFVESAISGQGPVKMLHAVWLEPVYTCGGDTFASEVISLAGGENIFAYLSGWPTVSMEQIIDSQPEVITITATMMMSSPEEIIQSLENDSLWNQIPAVQNGKVYILYGEGENIFNRQSVRIVDAVELLAGILYPDAFGVTVPNVIGADYVDYLPSQTSGSVATALNVQGSVGNV
jgi:iron complex transport system substrate-binding protein